MSEFPIMKKLCAVFLCFSIFCSFTSLYAVENQFEISLTVGGDITPPSIPTGLGATAVSSSQIDLSWTASTDNVSVLAYRVYRDSVFIATSSITTYSDVALSAGTLYSYAVSAVDTSFNESGQSSPASATTFSAPASGGGGAYPVIFNVQVIPTLTGAFVSWNTSQPSQTTFSWGETGSYELGSSLGFIFTTEHGMTITGLRSATEYQFQIVAMNGYGVSNSLDNLSFTTLSLAQGRENVRNFTATPEGSLIKLSWQNPSATDFSEVRLVRKEGYFPTDGSDGEVIYEGNLESLPDSRVEQGIRYYYAIFAKYSDGSLSSGSLASARITPAGEVPEIYDPFDSLPKASGVHPLIEALALIDFDFIQDGRKIMAINGNTIPINGEENLTVSLDYKKVPEILKTLLITLSHPSDPEKTFSFLLRVNDEKTAYIATIAPLEESGQYGVSISIVDYQNRGLKKIVGKLLATAGVAFQDNGAIFPWIVTILKDLWINILLLLIIAYLTYRAIKRKKEKKEKDTVSDDVQEKVL